MRDKRYMIICVSLFLVLLAGALTLQNYKNSGQPKSNKEYTQTYAAVGESTKSPIVKTLEIKDMKNLTPDMQRIMQRGKLIVGVYSQDRPPFFMTDSSGNLYGLDIDIAKNIAKELKVELEFNRNATSFNQLSEMLKNREIDIIISKFSRTLERAEYLNFTKPYINLRQTLLVNKLGAAKNKIEDYPMDFLKTAKVKIGVLKGTSFVEYAKSMFINAQIVEFENWQDAVDSLVKGEIFAALYDDNEIIKMVRKKPETAVYANVYALKDKKDPIAIAVNNNDTHLLVWLDYFIDTYGIEKSVEDLIKEYPEIYKEN